MITTVAVHQMRSLRRQRTFLALLGTFLVMTALAGVLGWSSQRTIVRVYEAAVSLLRDRGSQAPPNPFALKPTLSMLSNMAIYVPLIGALLALILGHVSLADDQATGVERLIFSRPVRRSAYFLGKVGAAAVVLALILVVSFVVSAVSLILVNDAALTADDLLRLATFYGLSWLYLNVFALVGMVTVLLARRRSMALLAGIGVWLVLTFAVPQFTSGLAPVASLHPVTNPVSTSQPFFEFTARGRPYSVTEQYKRASAVVLETAPSESTASTVRRVLPIVGLLVLLFLVAGFLVRRHDASTGIADE